MTDSHANREKKKLTLALDESGAVAIVFALIITTLCGFVALAVDVGHLFWVRAELQRTADAAALAGATGLVPYTGSLTNPTPNWLQGQSKAHTLINNAANQADNQTFSLTDGTVLYGYWLLKPPTGYVQTLPTARPTTTAYLPEPAVKVTLSRDVSLYFAPLIGVHSPQTVSVIAIATLPEAYGTTGVPPVAVSLDTVTNNIGGNLVIDAVEQDLKIQSNKGIAGWFNLSGDNSVPSVRINTPLTASTSQIYMVPGTKATLTDLINQGDTIVIPVVQSFSQKDWVTIIGFAAFKVDTLSSNSMTGHFVTQYLDFNAIPTAGTGNNLYGVGGTPKLVSP